MGWRHGGIPTGGTTGAVLAKASTADGDTEWVRRARMLSVDDSETTVANTTADSQLLEAQIDAGGVPAAGDLIVVESAGIFRNNSGLTSELRWLFKAGDFLDGYAGAFSIFESSGVQYGSAAIDRPWHLRATIAIRPDPSADVVTAELSIGLPPDSTETWRRINTTQTLVGETSVGFAFDTGPQAVYLGVVLQHASANWSVTRHWTRTLSIAGVGS